MYCGCTYIILTKNKDRSIFRSGLHPQDVSAQCGREIYIRDVVTSCRRNLYGIIYYNIIITCMVPASGLACLNRISYTRVSAGE